MRIHVHCFTEGREHRKSSKILMLMCIVFIKLLRDQILKVEVMLCFVWQDDALEDPRVSVQ